MGGLDPPIHRARVRALVESFGWMAGLNPAMTG